MNTERGDSFSESTRRIELREGQLTGVIISAFYEVYNRLGTGLLEKAYAGALQHELELRGLTVRREVLAEIEYKDKIVARHRTDMVVEDRVVVELKSTKHLNTEDHRQLLNFLRATRWEVGLLLHFGPRPLFYRMVSTNDDPRKYGRPQS